MKKPTIFIVDDQASVCKALAEMLSVFGYQVETFQSARDFLAAASVANPGCLLADVRMPQMDGLELLRVLKERAVQMPVIMMSGHADVPMAVAAIKAGAQEFIEKPLDDAQLVSAINRCLAQSFEQQSTRQSVEELKSRFALLTPREVEVFDLVVLGHTSQAIASLLKISARTVESYRVQIMAKLQAESVAVLVRQAVKLGRLEP